MTLSTTHPDDETLFDLIEGALDAASTQHVEAHLDSCPDCGQLVLAAISGSPDRFTPREELPAASAQHMYRALADVWIERLSVVASAAEVAPLAAEAAAPLAAPAPAQSTQPPRMRSLWSRRVMPALAFAVVIGLGGVTLQLEQQREPGTPGSATTNSAVAPQTSAGAASPQDTDAIVGRAPMTAAPAPSSTRMSRPLAELACVASFDSSQLTLPDDRVPQRTLQGPLGMYLVCG